MKNVSLILVSFLLFFLAGCNNVVAPDIIKITPDGKSLWIANRAGSELLEVGREQRKIVSRQSFPTPVNDMLLDPGGRLWVVCDGPEGLLCELNPDNLNIISRTPMGYTPSSVEFNAATGTLWVAQRYLGELWEIDPVSKQVVSRIEVGREPVDVVAVKGGQYLLVANNLPAIASTAYPAATHIDVVDAASRKIAGRIELVNGSTDARAIAVAPGEDYAYVTHLVGRYQLPTNQVDRGWMSTNAMSVLDLSCMSLETTILLDTPQRGAANPSAVEISPDGKHIVVALAGTHELAVIDRALMHDRLGRIKQGEKVVPSIDKWEDIPNDAGFLYGIREFAPTGGKGPQSFSFCESGIIAASYYTGEISLMDGGGDIRSSFVLGTPMTATRAGLGEMYFHDATLCFQQWQSCASCHPNQARVDGLNWDLVNDGVGNPKNTKSMLYSHQTAPSMITGIRKDAETAVRSGLKYILFSDQPDEISKAMDEYLKKLAPLPSPYLVEGALSHAAQRGKVNYDKYCASCHSGKFYTDQKKYPVSWATPKDDVPMDVPALVEIWRTAPYLYDGRSYTMREMLDVHGPSDRLSDNELDELAEYVLSL